MKSPHRESNASGTLQISVLEDPYGDYMGVKLAESHTFSVDLSPGESKSVSDSYVTGQYYDIRGFFIQVNWQGQLVYKMPQTYPPALEYLYH